MALAHRLSRRRKVPDIGQRFERKYHSEQPVGVVRAHYVGSAAQEFLLMLARRYRPQAGAGALVHAHRKFAASRFNGDVGVTNST